MSVADLIAPHLPSLRQFVQALKGRVDERVDAHRVDTVVDMVETAPEPPATSTAMKFALFRAVLSSPGRGRGEGRINGPSDTREEAGTSEARTAALLTSVGNFSVPEAADIMNVSRDEMDGFLRDAAAEMRKQPATSVLIIEDDPIIALDMESFVESLGHEVIGVARTRREAVMLARKLDPGLVLADVQLADDSSGIEAVNDFIEEVEAPVIFVTAFPHMLVREATGRNVHLVTKPFEMSALRSTIGEVLYLHRQGSSPEPR